MLKQVDDVITGDSADADRWRSHIHLNIFGGSGQVARFITDGGGDIDCPVGQAVWRNLHAPSAVSADGGGVIVAVKVDGHALAHFGIAATADSQGCARFGGVNHVVASDRIDRQARCSDIHMNFLRRLGGVTRHVGDADLHARIAISQVVHIGDRDGNHPITAGIDGGIIGVTGEVHFHHLARFHVLGAAAKNQFLALLGGIQHVITGYGVDRYHNVSQINGNNMADLDQVTGSAAAFHHDVHLACWPEGNIRTLYRCLPTAICQNGGSIILAVDRHRHAATRRKTRAGTGNDQVLVVLDGVDDVITRNSSNTQPRRVCIYADVTYVGAGIA
ncbi:hypothetical protein D3C73_524870 [compost metagenome]